MSSRPELRENAQSAMSNQQSTNRAAMAIADCRLQIADCLTFAVVSVLLLSGCRPDDMHNQAKYEVYEVSEFYADGRASRPLPEGVVPRGAGVRDAAFEDGKDAAGALLTSMPV